MTLESKISEDRTKLIIKVNGDFNSSVNNEFYTLLDGNYVDEYQIDLENAEHIDSSALGLLLVLRERANSSSSIISIVNANKRLKRILSMAKFDHLFSILE